MQLYAQHRPAASHASVGNNRRSRRAKELHRGDERDIQSLTEPQNFLTPFDTDLRDLSLGLCLDFGKRVWHPEVEAAIRAAANALAEAGARVEEVSLPWGMELDDLWLKHWEVYLATFFGHETTGPLAAGSS